MSSVQQQSVDPWAIDVPMPYSGEEYVPCPPGAYQARICGLFDVGHHQKERKNDKTGEVSLVDVRQLVVCFEVTDPETKQPNGAPYIFGAEYTWSMNEKASLRKLAMDALHRQFQIGEKLNPRELLGQAVSIKVVQTPNAKKPGKYYDNFKGASELMKGFVAAPGLITPVIWSLVIDGGNPPTLAWFPRIYGKDLATIVGNSREVQGFYPTGSQPASVQGATDAPSQFPAPLPPGPAHTGYSPRARYLMNLYGLRDGYTDLQLAELRGELSKKGEVITDEDFDVLQVGANPF